MPQRRSQARGSLVQVGQVLGVWRCEAQLGTGSFGIVHVWAHTGDSSRVVALKKCRFGSEVALSEKHCDQWRQEVDILQRLDHPNVVQCFPTPPDLCLGLQETESSLPLLCMEFCNGGDLRKVLNDPRNCCGLPQEEVLAIISDIASALGFLHNRRIIHRDLKPENVVLKETSERTYYKLIDLGYAKELGQSSLALSFVGTLQYIAPELFLSQTYSRSVDYWSLGFIAHEIVTGQRPFLPNMSPGQWMDHVQNKTHQEICIYQDQHNGKIIKLTEFFPENQLCLALAKELAVWLRSLLQWDPAQRGKNQAGEICIFNQLGAILSQSRVQIVCLERGIHNMDCVVDQTWTGKDLQEVIEREYGVPGTAQLLITCDGNQIQAFDNVSEKLEVADEPIVYVFNMLIQKSVPEQIKAIDLSIPASIQPCLQNPRAEVSYPLRKTIYAHTIAFTRKEQECLSQWHEGAQAFVLHLGLLVPTMAASSQIITKACDRIYAKFELFQESLFHDQEKYREQAKQKDHITSNRIFDSWHVAERDLKESLQQLHTKLSACDNQLSAVQNETEQINQKSSQLALENRGLEAFVERSLALYADLKKIPVEGRREKEDVIDVAKLVVKCLKQRYESLEQHIVWRQHLQALHSKCSQLRSEQKVLQQNMDSFLNALSKLQRRRQSDIWKLLAAALQQKDQSPRPLTPGGMVSGAQQQQIRLLECASERSRDLMSENEALRMQMQELLMAQERK